MKLEARKSRHSGYIDLYLDGRWIADIHVEPDGRIAFFAGELDEIARIGGTASAMIIIGGKQLVEIRHNEKLKAQRYLESVLDETTGQ